MAWIAISVPLSILLWQMNESNKQYKNTVEFDRNNQIRSQSVSYVEALNENDFISLKQDFIEECRLVQNGTQFNPKGFFSGAKIMTDNLNHSWLKLKMFIPNDKPGNELQENLDELNIIYFSSLIQFQIVISYMDNKNDSQMILDEFRKFYNKQMEQCILLHFSNYIKKNKTIPNSKFKDPTPKEPAFISIYNFALTILDEPIKHFLTSSIIKQTNEKTIAIKAQQLLSDYCNSKERTFIE